MNSDGKLLRIMLVANLVTFIFIPVLLIVLYRVRSILPPVLSALLVAYLTYPLVKWGYRIGIPRLASTLIVVLLLISSTVLIAVSFVPAIRQQVRVIAHRAERSAQPAPTDPQVWSFQLPEDLSLEPRLETPLPPVPRTLGEPSGSTAPPKSGWRTGIDEAFAQIRELGWPTITRSELIRRITSFVANESIGLVRSVTGLAVQWGRFLMIFFFVLVFALLDGHRMQRWLVGLLPNEFYESGLFVLHKTEQIMGDYLRGLFVENILLGLISVVLLFPICVFTDLKLMLMLIIALIIAVTNAIRIIGPIIGGAIGAFLALAYTGQIGPALAVVVAVIVIQVLDNTVVLPMVMREQVNIHPVVCLLSIIMGGLLGGVLGMILAIPVVSGIKVVYRVVSIEMKRYVEPEHYGDYTVD